MKYKYMFLLVLFFCGTLIFAETNTGDLEISDAELNSLVKDYLENTFKRYLRKSDLRVTEVSCTTDWNASKSDKNLNYFNAQARFRNFPINSRFLTGRLETKIAVRKKSGAILGWGGKPGIEDKDQKNLNITLLIDDQLSDELRDAMVRNYIIKNYENPLDINISRERMEVYNDKIYSYVSGIVNNDSIIYLRAVFESQQTKIEKVDIFTIQETPWLLNRAELIFSEKFPDYTTFVKDIQENMFEPMRGYYLKTIGNGNINKSGSKIESITKSNLIDANNGIIKLELDLIYELDLWGFIGSYKRYGILVYPYYKFNFEKQIWEYDSIEAIKTDNIRAIK